MFNIFDNLQIAAVIEHKYEAEQLESTYDLHLENMENGDVINIVVEVSRDFAEKHDLLKLVD